MSLPPRIVSIAGFGVNPATPYLGLAGHAGLPLSFSVVAEDPEQDPLTLAALFLGEGMTFDDGTRTFQWTPPDSFAGRTVVVRFQATTPSGGSAYALVRITVGAATTVLPPPPVGLALGPARPNPFHRHTTLVLTLPGPERIVAEIFDSGGRRVRELARGTFAAGRHELAWDGRDGGGRQAPPGVYLARVRARVRSVEARLVRIGGGAGTPRGLKP